MDKEFYYLEDNQQKGPYNIDQLKTLGLKLNTLVWTEGFEDWKAVKDVEELKILIKKLPPAPPLIENSVDKTTKLKEQLIKEKKKVKFWTLFKIFSIVILIFGFASLSAFIITNIKTQKLKEEIYFKVNKILNGKTVILDGSNSLTKGKLEDTDYGRKPKHNNLGLKGLIDKLTISRIWWNTEKLYSAFTKTSGGFEVLKLIKQNDDNFEIETILSGNMGYKEPISSYVSPIYSVDGRSKIIEGHKSNNYRLTVRECYQEAFEYFTKDDEDSPGAYSPGKFVDIANFSKLRNEYFDIYSTSQPEYSYANINTESWVVFYQKASKHLEIIENKKAIKKDFFIYFGVVIGIIMLLFFITIISIPNFYKKLYTAIT